MAYHIPRNLVAKQVVEPSDSTFAASSLASGLRDLFQGERQLFQAELQAALATAPDGGLVPNVAAVDARGLLVCVARPAGLDSGGASLIALHLHGSRAPSLPFVHLHCSPPLPPTTHLAFSPGGRYLAASGVSHCTVLEFSRQLRDQLLSLLLPDGSRSPVSPDRQEPPVLSVRAHAVDSFLFSTRPVGTLSVRQAAWHPLSDRHLALLTSDNALRLYDVEQPPQEPWVAEENDDDADDAETTAGSRQRRQLLRGRPGGGCAEAEQTWRLSSLPRAGHSSRGAGLSSSSFSGGRSPAAASTRGRRRSSGAGYLDELPAAVAFAFAPTGGAASHPSSPAAAAWTGSGGSETPGWESLAVHVLFDDCSLFALCPVLPIGCAVPAGLLRRLEEAAEAELHSAVLQLEEHGRQQRQHRSAIDDDEDDDDDDESVEPGLAADRALLEQLRMRLDWCRQVRGAAVARVVARAEAATTVDPDEEDGGAEADGCWVHVNEPHPQLQLLELQGPLEVLPPRAEAGATGGQRPCALLALDSQLPLTLVRLHADGSVDVLLAFEPLQPRWHLTNAHPAAAPQWLLYERLALPLPDGDERLLPVAALPLLLPAPPAYRDTFFIAHSGGVDRVCLRWLERLESFVASAAAAGVGSAGDRLPELPPATVDRLLDTCPLPTSPPSPVVGLAFVADAFIGHFVVARGWSGNVDCIPLSEPLLPPPPPPTAFNPSQNGRVSLPAAGSSLGQQVRPLPALPRLSLTDEVVLSTCTVEGLQLLQQNYQQMQSPVLYAKNLSALIASRLHLLTKQQTDQAAKLELVRDQLQRAIATQDRLAGSFTTAVDNQRRLSRRIGLILRILGQRQTVLSAAEAEYRDELAAMQRAASRYRQRIEQLTLQAEHMLKLLGPTFPGHAASAITQQQLARLQPELEAETERLSRTLASLDLLQNNVQRDSSEA